MILNRPQRVTIVIGDERTRAGGRNVWLEARVKRSMPPERNWVDVDPKEVGYMEIAGIFTRRLACNADLDELRVMTGRPDIDLFAVHSSVVRPSFRSTGLGVEMYIEAARYIAEKFGDAMAPHICDVGGFTSDAARRVWNSKRLSEVVIRSGDIVYWVGKERAR